MPEPTDLSQAVIELPSTEPVTQRYRHPIYGLVDITQRYSDLWTGVALNNGELVSCNPSMLSAVGRGSGIIEAQVTDLGKAGPKPAIAININTATPRQLADAVNGIGPAKASKIISRRPPNGYGDWEDLARLNQDLGLDWTEIALDNTIKFEG